MECLECVRVAFPSRGAPEARRQERKQTRRIVVAARSSGGERCLKSGGRTEARSQDAPNYYHRKCSREGREQEGASGEKCHHCRKCFQKEAKEGAGGGGGGVEVDQH